MHPEPPVMRKDMGDKGKLKCDKTKNGNQKRRSGIITIVNCELSIDNSHLVLPLRRMRDFSPMLLAGRQFSRPLPYDWANHRWIARPIYKFPLFFANRKKCPPFPIHSAPPSLSELIVGGSALVSVLIILACFLALRVSTTGGGEKPIARGGDSDQRRGIRSKYVKTHRFGHEAKGDPEVSKLELAYSMITQELLAREATACGLDGDTIVREAVTKSRLQTR